MKKKLNIVNNDIIDLTIIFKQIWESKIKIFIITLISIFLGYGYYSQIPDSFKNSLIVKQIDKSEFLKLIYVLEFIYEDKNILDSLNSDLSQRFVNKLKNSKELILKDKKSINKKEVIKLSDKKREYDYSNLLDFKKKDNNEFIISFKWHDSNEGSEILKKLIVLTVNNLQSSFYNELYFLLDKKKKKQKVRDKKIVSFLLEQRSIAKNLNIIDHEIDHIVSLSDLYSSYDPDKYLSSYYLRGVNFLDQQIEIINNRSYAEFADIREEINLLKTEIDLFDFNIETISVESQNNPNRILFQSFLLGLIVGTFYVIVFSPSQFQTASRKRTN